MRLIISCLLIIIQGTLSTPIRVIKLTVSLSQKNEVAPHDNCVTALKKKTLKSVKLKKKFSDLGLCLANQNNGFITTK
jgi:hypothetical protein